MLTAHFCKSCIFENTSILYRVNFTVYFWCLLVHLFQCPSKLGLFPMCKKKHIKKSDHPFISDTKYKPYLGFLKQTKLTKVVLNCNSSYYCVKLSTVQIKNPKGESIIRNMVKQTYMYTVF